MERAVLELGGKNLGRLPWLCQMSQVVLRIKTWLRTTVTHWRHRTEWYITCGKTWTASSSWCPVPGLHPVSWVKYTQWDGAGFQKSSRSKLGHHASDPYVHAPLFRVRPLKPHMARKFTCRTTPNSTQPTPSLCVQSTQVFNEKIIDVPRMKFWVLMLA